MKIPYFLERKFPLQACQWKTRKQIAEATQNKFENLIVIIICTQFSLTTRTSTLLEVERQRSHLNHLTPRRYDNWKSAMSNEENSRLHKMQREANSIPILLESIFVHEAKNRKVFLVLSRIKYTESECRRGGGN